jgi:hypothetical protein
MKKLVLLLSTTLILTALFTVILTFGLFENIASLIIFAVLFFLSANAPLAFSYHINEKERGMCTCLKNALFM